MLDCVFDVYVRSSPFLKRVFHSQLVPIIRAIGPSAPHLLHLLNSFPPKGESLILHFLNVLTESAKAPPELVAAVKTVYEQRTPDPRLLIPILPALDKDDIIAYLPKLITVPSPALKLVFSRFFASQPPAITPSELMVALHLLTSDPAISKDQSVMKKVIEATQLCLEQPTVFTPEVLAVVLQQLIDVKPIPMLTMRTVIQTVKKYPKLINFIMTLLSRLIQKQVWTEKKLWEGFIMCCKITEPHSFSVLASLPPAALESAVSNEPELKERLTAYCVANGIRVSL